MESDNILIQQASFEDLQEILSLQKKAFLSEAEAHGNYEIEPLLQTYESICADYDRYLFLKAVSGPKIVGSVKSRQSLDTVWIGKLMVDQDFRKKGIAKRLLKEVESYYPFIRKFQLFTAATSFHNILLYQSQGYEIVREYADDKQNGFMMVEMVKQIK
ncbi:MAG: GNAT family N-acetyltransferase [Bacteroidales bacterium]|nr:GNAT family N-acetyltransferase [Bacteroidales bacterium]